MEVRSYYASSVESAMEMARQELGVDALLIQANPSAADVSHLGRYEVVFAGELQQPRQTAPPEPVRTKPVPSSPSPIRPAVSRTPASAPPTAVPSPLNDSSVYLGPIDLVPGRNDFSALLALSGVDPEESLSFFTGASKQPAQEPQYAAHPVPTARRERACEFACSTGLGRPGFAETVVALVGPPGAGKTTTLMKLAVVHGLLVSRPVRFLSFDPERVGAAARLRSFAQLLDISFEDFETLEELSGALDRPAPGLTLIDTAGHGRGESEAISELARCLLNHAKVETQLVLKVDRKTADNLEAFERYSPLKPARLILTGLDESADNGGLGALIEQTELPLSFFGVGQRIPEDLEPARDTRLPVLVSGRAPDSARGAA